MFGAHLVGDTVSCSHGAKSGRPDCADSLLFWKMLQKPDCIRYLETV